MYFSNGGRLSFSAELDESGTASDTDHEGASWDFSLDMHSQIVDDAINEWANANGVQID